MASLTISAGASQRILQGHRWVFANEVTGRIKEYQPGSWVEVVSNRDVALGTGYVNPHSLIAVRLVGPPGQQPTEEFFAERLEQARLRRHRWYPGTDVYRLVYGESDGLPGLVVDRYGSVFVYQISTLGMARYEGLIQHLLRDRFQAAVVVCRNDLGIRALEGLPQEKKVVHGSLEGPIEVTIDGLITRLDPLHGQKTGCFLDQRDNRRAAARWFADRDVLDLFCYDGSWGLAAAAQGARRVVAVDQSRRALALAADNAERNGLAQRCRLVAGDAFTYLKEAPGKSVDLVVLDPPAFIKSKKALKEGMKGYTDINRRALLALKSPGILITCSCSYHLSAEAFRQVLVNAGKAAGRTLRLLESRGQAADHPVLLAMPETRYLKCLVLEVE